VSQVVVYPPSPTTGTGFGWVLVGHAVECVGFGVDVVGLPVDVG
jgi:hypothetical protein